MMISVSDSWKAAYPQAHLGTLVMNHVANPRRDDELSRRKTALERELRASFAGQDKSQLAAMPTMQAYRSYYKRFRKTYHVLLQLRSVALQGKPIPNVAALVEAMFMAEVRNGLLTAGHDLHRVQEPITLTTAQGDEAYTMLNGREQTLKQGDMIMTDAQGVICSVLYGLDRRTAITGDTQRVLFAVYVPCGITTTAIRRHLEEIRDNVRVITPQAETEELHVYGNYGYRQWLFP